MRVVLVVALLTVCACSGSPSTTGPTRTQKIEAAGLRFVAASPRLVAACHSTARAVAYAVPCPMRVPEGLNEAGAIGPGGIDGAAKSWRGWVVGSSYIGADHLVITASPGPLRNYAKVVNGHAWYPDARARLLRRMTVNGWRIQAVYVPFGTNAGSAFARHVVLIWTVGGHTYGVGFHNVHGIRPTLDLDLALARGIMLVAPVD